MVSRGHAAISLHPSGYGRDRQPARPQGSALQAPLPGRPHRHGRPPSPRTRRWLPPSRRVPEMMRRELFHQRRGQPVAHHQEEGDHDVMVALVVVQLGVALQDVEDDVDEILLQPFPLVIRHPCGDSSRRPWDGAVSPAGAGHGSERGRSRQGEDPCLYQAAGSQGAWGKGTKLAEKRSRGSNPAPQNSGGPGEAGQSSPWSVGAGFTGICAAKSELRRVPSATEDIPTFLNFLRVLKKNETGPILTETASDCEASTATTRYRSPANSTCLGPGCRRSSLAPATRSGSRLPAVPVNR